MLVYLALHATKTPANTLEIASAEKISKDYVEQILTRLRTAGLVTSHRGIKGGFSLARDPKDVTVRDIVEFTEGKISIAPCLKGDTECGMSTSCATQSVWEATNNSINQVLSSYTIHDLCQSVRDRKNILSFNI